MPGQNMHMSEPPFPPLDEGQLLKIKEHPFPTDTLQGMRADMATRKASAGSQFSDEEVLAGILIVGFREGDKQDQKITEDKEGFEEKHKVDDQANAVRNFVKSVLSFLSRTDAAKVLEFRSYIPTPPGPHEAPDPKGESIPAGEGIGEGKEQELEKAEGIETNVDKSFQSSATTPPTISFSDALELITPLWPHLSPQTSGSVTEATKAIAEDDAQKKPYVLPLTVQLFYKIMGHDQPLGYQNDVEIWQALQNLLHLYLSPILPAAAESTESNKTGQKAKEKCLDLMRRLKAYAEAHPYRFGGQVALGVLGFFPGIVLGPILGALGFGATGVVAGSAAAAWQSSFAGFIPAGCFFSMCQSFAMSGPVGAVLGSSISAAAAGIGTALGVSGNKSSAEKKSEGQTGDSGDGVAENGSKAKARI